MAIDDLKTVERLRRQVTRLTSNVWLRQDLMQEALIHLWQIQQLQPGHTKSWYLQSCRYHVQHRLAFGRSIDSPKRSSSRVHPSDNEDHDSLWEVCDNVETINAVWAEVSARDIINSMCKRLTKLEQAILKCLADGLRTIEIARRLNISYPTVIKHRRKIATLATRLGLSSFPEYQIQPGVVARQVNGERKFESNEESANRRTINGATKINGHVNESRVQLTLV